MLVNALKYLLCKFDPVAAEKALPNGVIPNVTKSSAAVSKSYLETTNDTSLNKTKDKLSKQKTKDKKKDYKKKKSRKDDISLDSEDYGLDEVMLDLKKGNKIASPPLLGKKPAIQVGNLGSSKLNVPKPIKTRGLQK